MKNLSNARRKIGATGGAGKHPPLHVTFNERTFVLRSEQTEDQNFLALRTSCTFGESDCVANIQRHGASLSKTVYALSKITLHRESKGSAGKIE
jgi:hypothetical protein